MMSVVASIVQHVGVSVACRCARASCEFTFACTHACAYVACTSHGSACQPTHPMCVHAVMHTWNATATSRCCHYVLRWHASVVSARSEFTLGMSRCILPEWQFASVHGLTRRSIPSSELVRRSSVTSYLILIECFTASQGAKSQIYCAPNSHSQIIVHHLWQVQQRISIQWLHPQDTSPHDTVR